TEFLEQVNYRRALEGEIARTIATISEVAGARLHIAMARESLFGAREQPAKASVILKLRNPNRPLSPATIAGITNLVAASVEGLLSAASEERTEETWDPEPVVRSRQTSSEGLSGPSVGAVAGARANLPPPADEEGVPPATLPAAQAVLAGGTRTSETTNYEISRVTRHTVKPAGDIARLSVAVILDDEVVTSTQED